MVGQEMAETLALQALAWMLGEADVCAGFLAATGAQPGDLRALAREPAFLGAVLDHLLADERLLLAFAAAAGIAPEAPGRARLALPGGADRHWT